MKRLIVGITGASGVAYGVRLLEALRATEVESHLVMSKPAEVTLAHETEHKVAHVRGLADAVYANRDVGAAIASGSFKTMGMIVVPCSIKTLSQIASGATDNLMSRAADVVLKERRRLVLMVRETPLHAGHLRAMLTVSELGAIIAPPMPAFYAAPAGVADIVDHTVGRALDLFDIESDLVRRWREPAAAEPDPQRAARRDR